MTFWPNNLAQTPVSHLEPDGFYCLLLLKSRFCSRYYLRSSTAQDKDVNSIKHIEAVFGVEVGMHFHMLSSPRHNSRAPIFDERHILFVKSSTIQLRESACLPLPFFSNSVFVALGDPRDVIVCFFDFSVLAPRFPVYFGHQATRFYRTSIL